MSHQNRASVALSIRQPWAWAIVNGYKDIENRTWSTNFRGKFFIHAGKKFDKQGYEWIRSNFDIKLPDRSKFECGGLVGIAELVDIVMESNSRWFEGPYGYIIHNATPIAFVSARGQLGFFELKKVSLEDYVDSLLS